MSDYAELVGLLQVQAAFPQDPRHRAVTLQAADAIKALVQERDALKRVHDDIMQAIDECGSYKP